MSDQNKQLNQCEKDLISKCCGAKILLPTMDSLPYWNCSACGKAVILEAPCTRSNYAGEEKKPKYTASQATGVILDIEYTMSEARSLHPQELDWKEKLMDEFCVMFERAQDDTVVERLESFIESLLALHEKKARASRDEQWKQVINEIFPEWLDNLIVSDEMPEDPGIACDEAMASAKRRLLTKMSLSKCSIFKG